MDSEHKPEQEIEQDTIDSKSCHAEPAGRLIRRHILAGLICVGISCVAMAVFVVGVSFIAPVARERILVMAFWISIGVFMVGTLMGFGRKNPERTLGCFPSLILAPLAGFLFGIVLYGLFLLLRLPVYDGDPSSVWLTLGIGVLFGAIGWGNFLGWLSTKTIQLKDGPKVPKSQKS